MAPYYTTKVLAVWAAEGGWWWAGGPSHHTALWPGPSNSIDLTSTAMGLKVHVTRQSVI